VLLEADIPVIDHINSEIFVEHVEESGLSEQGRAVVNPSSCLALGDGCTQIGQFFDISVFGGHQAMKILLVTAFIIRISQKDGVEKNRG
jgi:hypothetical protein